MFTYNGSRQKVLSIDIHISLKIKYRVYWLNYGFTVNYEDLNDGKLGPKLVRHNVDIRRDL